MAIVPNLSDNRAHMAPYVDEHYSVSPPEPPPVEGGIVGAMHFRDISYGSGDGSDWENAKAFPADLNAEIAAAPDGKRLVILAGTYNLASHIDITAAGGTAISPVVVEFVNADGTDGRGLLIGTRQDPFVGLATVQGAMGLKCNNASGIRFKRFDWRAVGNGCLNIAGTCNNIWIEDWTAENVYRGIETGPTATPGNWVGGGVDGFTILGSERGNRICGTSNNLTLNNLNTDCDFNIGAAFAIGIAFDNTAHDIVVNNSYSKKCAYNPGVSSYGQGDGFCTEAGNYNITFNDILAEDCNDGGCDLKGADNSIVVNGFTALRCGKSLRWHGDASGVTIRTLTVTDFVSEDPTILYGNSFPTDCWCGNHATINITNAAIGPGDPGVVVWHAGEDVAKIEVTGTYTNASSGTERIETGAGSDVILPGDPVLDPAEFSTTLKRNSTLSGGNLTATGTANFVSAVARAIAKADAGAPYVTFDFATLPADAEVGFVDDSIVDFSTYVPGSDAHSYMWRQNGDLYTSGAVVGAIDPWTATDLLYCRINGNKIGFRKNAVGYVNITVAGLIGNLRPLVYSPTTGAVVTMDGSFWIPT